MVYINGILGTKSQDGCVSVLTYSKDPMLNYLVKEEQGIWDCSHRGSVPNIQHFAMSYG